MENKKAIIIGCGVAGPTLALALNRAGIESEIYEAQTTPSNFGLLSLSTNGIQVLKMLNVYDDIQADDNGKIFFYNHAGKSIFSMDFGSFLKDKFGSGMIINRREEIIDALTKKTISAGIKIEFGKKLVDVKENNDKVTAYFEDGTSAEGDFLIGCDGMRSKTRTTVFPEALSPTYSGAIAVVAEVEKSTKHEMIPNAFHMTFGKQTFAGSVVGLDGRIIWWSYVRYPEKAINTDLKKISPSEWTQKLLKLHKDDVQIKKFIKSSKDNYVIIPIYDLPHIDTWHKGNVCLIGDAAHATSPHIGQGASFSLEDAIILAKCIRDIPNLDDSFKRFELMRKSRAEKLVREAQASGNFVLMTNPIKKLFSRLFMSLMLRESTFRKRQNWIFSYKIDWDEKIQENEN